MIRALHAAFMTMMRQFDADLQREHRLSHTEYVAMEFLAEAPDRTLGLSDLAAWLPQSLSAMSRTIGRLEAQGLVRREQSTRDARACNAVLTDAGLQRYNEATPTHNTSQPATFSITSRASTSTPLVTRWNASAPPPTIGRLSPPARRDLPAGRPDLAGPVRTAGTDCELAGNRR